MKAAANSSSFSKNVSAFSHFDPNKGGKLLVTSLVLKLSSEVKTVAGKKKKTNIYIYCTFFLPKGSEVVPWPSVPEVHTSLEHPLHGGLVSPPEHENVTGWWSLRSPRWMPSPVCSLGKVPISRRAHVLHIPSHSPSGGCCGAAHQVPAQSHSPTATCSDSPPGCPSEQRPKLREPERS